MTQKIRIKRRATSTIPDDILTNNKLSWAARVVLGWMLGRSPDFDLRIWYVRKCFVMSEQQWVKIRKEMQEEGFFFQQKEQGESGKFVWTNIVSDQPEFKPSPQNAGGGSPCDGKPSPGDQGDKPFKSNTIKPTTTTIGEVADDIDDLVEAAIWAAGSQVIKPGHYRAGIRKRLTTSLPTPDDLATLAAWREAQATRAAAASLPVGKWKSKQGSLIVIPETGPISITTRAGQLLSKHRAEFARDLAHGEVELLELEAA